MRWQDSLGLREQRPDLGATLGRGPTPLRQSCSLRWPRSARGWVATGLTATCLVALAWQAQLPALASTARQVSYPYLGLALLLSLLSVVCKGARWRRLYPSEERPALGLAVAAVAVGQVANWAIPARAGEVVRLGLVSGQHAGGVGSREEEREGKPRVEGGAGTGSSVALGAGVLVAEKLLDGAMLVLAVGLLALLGGLPAWLNALALLLVAAGGGALVLAALLRARGTEGGVSAGELAPLRAASPLWEVPRPLGGLGHQLRLVEAGLSAWLTPRGAAEVGLLSLLAWGLGGAVNWVALRSLGLAPDLGPALAVLVALYGGAVLPSLPGRLGVFQYLCVLALLPYGVGLEQALAFSVVLYAAVYLPPLALGLLAATLVGSRLPLPRRLP